MSLRLCSVAQRIANKQLGHSQLKQRIKLSSIDIDQLKLHIYGKRFVKTMNEFYSFIQQQENLATFCHYDIQQHNRDQQRLFGHRQMFKVVKRFPIDVIKDPEFFMQMFYLTAMFDGTLTVKGLGHFMLYMKTLAVFSDQNNSVHQQLIERGKTLKDIGGFALTQLQHGSYVKGILTTAIYDQQSKQFILNSNGNPGMKFWIGSASQAATKSIIWAQLIVKGQSYGPHPFVVPLRDPQTYDLVPGVVIGDCGPKNGGNNIDNGYIILNDLRIPKDFFLDKLGKIDSQGNYHSPIKSNDKRFGSHLAPLSSGRSLISFAIIGAGANCLAVALRYVSSRRQFQDPLKKQQKVLIDYPLMRHRICPLLAQCYVYYIGSLRVARLYCQNANELSNPQSKITNEMHAISAIGKAMSTWTAVDMITECREVMGGHGYSSYSRIGALASGNDVSLTFEGDNNLLLQQVAKFLLKVGSTGKKTHFLNMDFFSNEQLQDQINNFVTSFDPQTHKNKIDSLNVLRKICQYRIKTYFNIAIAKMQQLKMLGLQNTAIWNKSQSYECRQLAFAYGDYFYFMEVEKSLKEAQGTKMHAPIQRCLKIWFYQKLEKQKFGNISLRKFLQSKIINLCDQIYPDALKMIAVITPPRQIIGSPFAREDGQGMKQYIGMLFSSKKTFERVDWYQNFLEIRQKQ